MTNFKWLREQRRLKYKIDVILDKYVSFDYYYYWHRYGPIRLPASWQAVNQDISFSFFFDLRVIKYCKEREKNRTHKNYNVYCNAPNFSLPFQIYVESYNKIELLQKKKKPKNYYCFRTFSMCRYKYTQKILGKKKIGERQKLKRETKKKLRSENKNDCLC